ncbi:MAG: ATP-binding cassette domain-containing protein, partial [Burkholderiaceae bacterium]
YTRRLLASHPQRMAQPLTPAQRAAAPLLQARDVRCTFTIKRGWLAQTRFVAVDGIDLELRRGETLGIVGESGSGKSTLGMALLRLSAAAVEGGVRFDGADLLAMPAPELRGARARMQVVFQDPFASLSPRRTIAQIVGEGLEIHRPQLAAAERRQTVAAALEEVGLTAAMMARYPHEFSGGQRQRIAIARALVLQPELILLDEPTSSLDVSVQQQVLQLLAELQRRHGIAYLFISHDLAVIRAMAHRVMVMKDGKVVEAGSTEAVLSNPAEPYTRRLLAASEYAELADA